MGLIRCRWLWNGRDRARGPAQLEWDGRGRITYLGEPRGGAADTVAAVLPGLVNAHAHVQLAPLARVGGEDFVSWIGRVVGQRTGETPAAMDARSRDQLAALWRDGCTAVGEIDSVGTSPAALRAVPLAGRCYQEVLGFDLGSDRAVNLLRVRTLPGTRSCPGGLSPHAPYSTSAALFRAAGARAAPMTIHAAEIPEEQALLRHGRGPLVELLRSLDRLPSGWRPPGVGTVEYLEGLGVLGPRTSLVHCQHLLPGDLERLVRWRTPVVVCPNTIRWFDRSPPPVPEWLRAGVPVALGTDSRASNRHWSMRQEMATARALWPGLAPQEVLRMGTGAAAAALARPALGRLRTGGRADLVVLESVEGSPDGILDRWTSGEVAPDRVLLAGQRAHS